MESCEEEFEYGEVGVYFVCRLPRGHEGKHVDRSTPEDPVSWRIKWSTE